MYLSIYSSIYLPSNLTRYFSLCLFIHLYIYLPISLTYISSHDHAEQHITVLVEADRRGHYSHGFNRLRGHYVADIRSKVSKKNIYTKAVILKGLLSVTFILTFGFL